MPLPRSKGAAAAPCAAPSTEFFDEIMLASTLKPSSPHESKSNHSEKLEAFTQAANLPNSQSWVEHESPEVQAARSEVVRSLEVASVQSSRCDLDLSNCDAQACLDLPDFLANAYATACTKSEPPTIRLTLPRGLTEVPAWITKFHTLKELTVPGFIGDANAALQWLAELRPNLTVNLPQDHATNSEELPGSIGIEREIVVHAAPSITTLRSIYKPYVGTLDAGVKQGLQSFMDELRQAIGDDRLDLERGCDYHLGGFKVVRSGEELALLKLAAPPHTNFDLDPNSAEAEDLPKAIEVFNTHFELVRAAVWQAMSKCSYVDYLATHATELVDDKWDILVNIDPYFSRDLSQFGAHKDTEGENMFLILLYCNDQPMMGPEYQLRPQNPTEYVELMRKQLPAVFVDEAEEILKEPPEGWAYAPTIEPWGFIAGCDDLISHSTPFVHHRGAFDLQSIIKWMGAALKECFGPGTRHEYLNAQIQYDQHLPISISDDLARGAHDVAAQLEKLGGSDLWIDRSKLKDLLHEKLGDGDAEKLFNALAAKALTEDPFDGNALIDMPRLDFFGHATVPRGKALRREMSARLEQGTALPYPASRDYLRVWIMARPKSSAT